MESEADGGWVVVGVVDWFDADVLENCVVVR